jgi:DNA-directed RNA polymerase specialized sigma24 family protein
MCAERSITLCLRRLQAGDRAALQPLWERYFRRLVGLARRRLHGAPRQAADEEDIALSAFDSFYRGVEQGRFPRLEDRDDLWQLLVLLAARKAADLAAHERCAKRGGGQVRHLSALGEGDWPAFEALIGREPDPAFAVQVAEQCEHLLGRLADPTLRQLAVWKLEGHSNQEIAGKLGCALPTVERKLRRIRGTWEKEGGP